MMKQIVQTTGDFQLYLPYPEHYAHAHRPSVVATSTFFEQHAAAGRIQVLGQVSDEATDEELVKYLEESKGDVELAVASFIAAFSLPVEAEEAPPPKKKAPAKG